MTGGCTKGVGVAERLVSALFGIFLDLVALPVLVFLRLLLRLCGNDSPFRRQGDSPQTFSYMVGLALKDSWSAVDLRNVYIGEPLMARFDGPSNWKCLGKLFHLSGRSGS